MGGADEKGRGTKATREETTEPRGRSFVCVSLSFSFRCFFVCVSAAEGGRAIASRTPPWALQYAPRPLAGEALSLHMGI